MRGWWEDWWENHWAQGRNIIRDFIWRRGLQPGPGGTYARACWKQREERRREWKEGEKTPPRGTSRFHCPAGLPCVLPTLSTEGGRPVLVMATAGSGCWAETPRGPSGLSACGAAPASEEKKGLNLGQRAPPHPEEEGEAAVFSGSDLELCAVPNRATRGQLVIYLLDGSSSPLLFRYCCRVLA